MASVRGAEGVVHIDICVAGQGPGEFLLTLFHLLLCGFISGVGLVDARRFPFFFRIEPEVFEKKNLSGLQFFGRFLRLGAIGCELHIAAQSLGHRVADLKETESGVDLAFRFPHVRHKNETSAVGEYFLECGEGAADSCVVGYVAVFIKRHIEVYSDDSFFVLEIVIFNLCHCDMIFWVDYFVFMRNAVLPSGRKFTNFFLLCERLLPGNGEIQLNLQYQKPFMTSSIKKQILTGRNGTTPFIINRFFAW